MTALLPPAVIPVALMLQCVTATVLAAVAWYRVTVLLPLLSRAGLHRRTVLTAALETLEQFSFAPLILIDAAAACVLLVAWQPPQPLLSAVLTALGLALLAVIVQWRAAQPRLVALARAFSARETRALRCAAWSHAVIWTLRAALLLLLLRLGGAA